MAEGKGFGEVALMYNDKRTASIVAVTDCICWALEANVFKNIIIRQMQERRVTGLAFLDKVELLDPLDKYEKLRLLDGLQV